MADIVELAGTSGEDISQEVLLEETTTAYVSLMDTTADVLDIQNAKIGELRISVNTEVESISLDSGDPDVAVDPQAAMAWLQAHRDKVDMAIAELEGEAEPVAE